MVSAPCMAHDMLIPMVMIALYPKHIQDGEVREMFLLYRMSYKVLFIEHTRKVWLMLFIVAHQCDTQPIFHIWGLLTV